MQNVQITSRRRRIPRTLLLVVLAGASAGCTTGRLSAPVPERTSEVPNEATAYHVFDGAGAAASLEDVLAALDTVAVLFVGESHGDPMAHRLEQELLHRAHRKFAPRRTLVLSLEMLERDVQVVVDEYLAGLITEEHFRQSARLGAQFADRYGPQVAFAKEHGLPVVAANAPRRYANLVSREGISALNGLSNRAREWLAPLPFPDPSPAYREKWLDVMQHMESADAHTPRAPVADRDSTGAREPAISNMLHAQVLWDATMAHAIAGALTKHEAPLVLHVVGSFHISGGTGLPEQLRHFAPGAPFVTLLIRPSAEPASSFDEELRGTADFVIQTTVGAGR